jgi:prepilin-type N-terminal cleavage/methylation domain-containing protein
MAIARRQRGLTLIELMLAMTVAALIFAALESVLALGLQAQLSGRQTNETAYQARFALEKIAAKARSVAPKLLLPPLSGSTGNWFTPVLYCLNSNKQLVETVVSDTACAQGAVIAHHVSAFSAQLPAELGPVDDPVASLTLTLQTSGAPAVTLTTSVRLGGGAM